METSNLRMLFDVLDKIGASERIRKLHQEAARYFEIIYRVGYFGKIVYYNFGSFSEGTTTTELRSDFDMVTCHTGIPVVLNLTDAPQKDVAALLTSDHYTAPGYVKLLFVYDGFTKQILHNNHFLQNHENSGLIKRDKYGFIYWKNVSSLLQKKTPFENVVHGPATTNSYPSVVSIDVVHALQCQKWPPFASEWLTRNRQHGWPDKCVINHCNRLGFFVVKVGHPYSKENDIEWRVSFSFQERLLMYNLTDVQHKCYILLKLIKRDLIVDTIGDSITSYHCKTCIFYAIEQNPQSIWYPENLFQCVLQCLKILLDWTRKEHCPNYFIPDENMFDGTVTGKIRIKVIDVLEHIIDEGESFINRIKTDHVGQYFKKRKNTYETEVLENISDYNTGRMIYKLTYRRVRNLLAIYMILSSRTYKEEIDQTLIGGKSRIVVLHAIANTRKLIGKLYKIKSINEFTTEDTRDVIDPLFPFLHSTLACHLFSLALQSEDVSLRNKYLFLSQKEFQKGMFSDVASGRLKYITSLYIRGNYKLCEEELVLLEKQIQPSSISVSPLQGLHIDITNVLQDNIYTHNYSAKYLLQNNIWVCLVFFPMELEMIPYALQFEMFKYIGPLPLFSDKDLRHLQSMVFVESKVYMYYLWYLLARRMNRPMSILNRYLIVEKLKLATAESVFHKETAFNLLAWVLTSENLIPQAMQYLVLSWRDDLVAINNKFKQVFRDKIMNHNAAKLHMLLILRQVWFTNDSVSFCFKCFEQSSYGFKTCSGCHKARYCSKNCQRNDWKVHKQICKQI